MKPKLEALRRELDTAGPRGPGRRYPPELRARLVAWADAERRRGRDWGAIAEALGVPVLTVRRWCAPPRPEAVPVVVRGGPTEDLVSLVAPSGWRIEGLSLASALDLLRRTPC